jgi:hypothetical protein
MKICLAKYILRNIESPKQTAICGLGAKCRKMPFSALKFYCSKQSSMLREISGFFLFQK